ncbi:MAG TPA: thioredoxin family protein [Planctomycetota bacterium]|nr:thioredoxin family protein [Planctomycetota bacterium]
MARTASTQRLAVGAQAPDFALPDTSGRTVRLADFAGRPLVVVFMCNHCPFVKHVSAGLAAFARDFAPRGLPLVGINSNDVVAHPDDSPAAMRVEAARAGWDFPYLFDEPQDVARAWHAACTPDVFLLDRAHRVAYRGQLDGSRPGNGIPVTGEDLRAAAEAVLAGRPVPGEQHPSIGCNIKWKPGREPDAIHA